jgi:hypothetical protein
LIKDDATARDVVALQRKRVEVERFRRLLDDHEFGALRWLSQGSVLHLGQRFGVSTLRGCYGD